MPSTVTPLLTWIQIRATRRSAFRQASSTSRARCRLRDVSPSDRVGNSDTMAWERYRNPGLLLAMSGISILVLWCFAAALFASTLALAAQPPETLQRARGLLEHGQVTEASHIVETLLQRH